MSIRQISIFVENQTGHLSEVSSLLANSGVNLRALSIADTKDFGILRIMVENVDKAVEILKENEFTYIVTDVLAVVMEDRPGGLAAILKVLSGSKISIEYAYAFLLNKQGKACLVIRVDDNKQAEEALSASGIKTVTQEELYGA